MITSEKYLIILHHPAFIVDNTFQEIQNWIDKAEFGPIHEIYVYKNHDKNQFWRKAID